MDRAVLYSPWMRCLPNGNQALTFSRSTAAGTRRPARRPLPAGREIDALLIPGAESSGPAARHVHPAHDGVLRPDMADEVNSPVDEHPPEVRALALKK